jgi:outer membrane receptor protein involved in Fe transport
MCIDTYRGRLLSTCAGAALAVVTFGLPASAADATFQFNIPAEPLAQALTDFSQKSSQQIVFSEDDLKGKGSAGLHGQYTATSALTLLLQGTNLIVGPNSSGVLVVRPKNAQAASNDGAAKATTSFAVETVLVTANKEVESASNVPMSLTVLTGDKLAREQSFRFEDFVGKVPGLTLIDFGSLGSQLVIRGITTGINAVNSQVATYIDDTPYTAPGPYGGSYLIAPNIDTYDMNRIEVLKGPQGTLYGATALGGLLKYVTNAPDPSGFQASGQAGTSSTQDGGTGYDLHAMVNVPLSDDLALRVVGYDNFYAGFIDDPSRGLKDSNGSHFTGGRASLLWEPTSELSLRLNAVYQNRSWGDWNTEDVSSGTLTPIHGELVHQDQIAQPGHSITQVYNGTVNWDAGFAKIFSTTSWSLFQPRALEDYSNNYGGLVSGILGTPVGVALKFRNPVQAFTQELRASSSIGDQITWQVGGYFTNEHATLDEGLFPVSSNVPLYNFPQNVGSFLITTHYLEYAGFANVDYHITPTFDIAAGGRYSYNNQNFQETGAGLLVGPQNIYTPSSQGVFTYSGDARWHVTDETMIYGRVADGFVPGGPNDVIATANVPHSYEASTALNLEAGVKSSLLDDKLTVDLSVFHIDWQKIQLSAFIGGLQTTVNGGAAISQGAEWNFNYSPISGLTLGFNGAFTDAHLSQPTPASVNGKAGARLPAVPMWGTAVSADYRWLLSGDYYAFTGVDWRFTGSRYADFDSGGVRQEMPSYNSVDFRAGVETGTLTYSLYVKNLSNEIGINYLMPQSFSGGAGPQSAIVTTPRTVGFSIAAKY